MLTGESNRLHQVFSSFNCWFCLWSYSVFRSSKSWWLTIFVCFRNQCKLIYFCSESLWACPVIASLTIIVHKCVTGRNSRQLMARPRLLNWQGDWRLRFYRCLVYRLQECVLDLQIRYAFIPIVGVIINLCVFIVQLRHRSVLVDSNSETLFLSFSNPVLTSVSFKWAVLTNSPEINYLSVSHKLLTRSSQIFIQRCLADNYSHCQFCFSTAFSSRTHPTAVLFSIISYFCSITSLQFLKSYI